MNYLQIKNNEPILYEGDKVIAGHGTNLKVNLSKLSEEVKKAIGWVDVEALALQFAEGIMTKAGTLSRLNAIEWYRAGFKTAQSLNEKRFTEDDLRKAYGRGFNHRDFESVDDESWKKFENTLSAPKHYPCEIETEQLLVNDKGKPIYPDKEGIWKVTPRIENNSIKVLKVRI